MTQSPTRLYGHLLRTDFCAFIHRAFLQLYPGIPYLSNWHIELIASKLEDVRTGRCKRLIVNVSPRHLKSVLISIVFPTWLLGHDPTKQIMSVTYSQDLSDNLARRSRSLMMSPFYQALFDTRISPDREAVADFETTAGGNRFATSLAGVMTGRGADVIIIDDPLKADDALSERRRRAVNARYDGTLRTRLNNQNTGAIIVTMQRLHIDDLVAHVQQQESWDILSLPAIAEQDEICGFRTSYGYRRIVRRQGDILHPDLLSREALEALRRGMTDYNFASPYQQNPQPPAGNIVKRGWLKFYSPEEKPDKFDHILQAWDTANKETELADYSVGTTWGIKDKHLYLLDLFRDKLEFPALQRKIEELAELHHASIVLIEDKASGTSLIQELRGAGLSQVQAAPSLDGDKIMRLRVQTGKIEGGFVHFPQQAPWLDDYLHELLAFPNAKYADQVDSTVIALVWGAVHPEPAIIQYYRKLATTNTAQARQGPAMRRIRVPGDSTTCYLISGRQITIPLERIIEVTEEEGNAVKMAGGEWVD